MKLDIVNQIDGLVGPPIPTRYIYILTGKYADSHSPTRNLIAYKCETFFAAEEQNVKIDQKTSSVGMRIDGRTRVTRMTAGNCPIT